jgi:nucleoside-diphosphate-sugar epimerase
MKIIVTGANGFIGSALIARFVASGAEILAIDLSFTNGRLPQSEKIIRKELSAEQINELQSIVKKGEYEIFYHLAWKGVNGAAKNDVFLQIENIETAVKCAETAKKLGCKRFLCAGTIAEQAVGSLPQLKITSPSMIYGVAKYCTNKLLETYCKSIDLPFIWMQFSNIYGPQNKTGNLISYTITELMNNRAALFGPAEQPYDFIYIDDLIEAVFRLASVSSKEVFYYIGSGKTKTLKEYLKTIGILLNKPELIKISERPDDGIRYNIEMFNNRNLLRDIGSYVKTSFEEGIQKIVDSL